MVAMTWTAPDVTRTRPPKVADERTMLESWLDFHRDTLLWKCSGLTAERLRVASCPPSPMSLLGLVRHMTDVERGWFRWGLAGEQVPDVYDRTDDEDADFAVGEADAQGTFGSFVAELAAVRAVAARHALDDTFERQDDGVEISLRWVYVHMIEEYARHNGHADLIRERVDGETGD
jgi:hypothetical protein